jgi:hypothetical protein
MRTDHPTVNLYEGAKEFMSEESSTIGLLEINPIGGKDTGQKEGRACKVHVAEDFAACVMARLPREYVLFGWNGTSIDGIKKGIVLTSWIHEQETNVEEFHVGCSSGCIIF